MLRLSSVNIPSQIVSANRRLTFRRQFLGYFTKRRHVIRGSSFFGVQPIPHLPLAGLGPPFPESHRELRLSLRQMDEVL